MTRPTFKITNHHELRIDVGIDCSSPLQTDQSYANACDINTIMANYAKTGMLSHVSAREPRYIDNTTIPNLEDAYNIVTTAENMFYDLPPDIRKLMDNDPQNLESFIADPKNHRTLEENGLIVSRPTQVINKQTETVVQEVPNAKQTI